MTYQREYLELDDDSLLSQCDVHIYKSSGPGGQHRNKVSSAVRLRHRITGLAVHSDESRSQRDNRRIALRRLRMNLACRLRRPIDPGEFVPPTVVTECMHSVRGSKDSGRMRLTVGRRDRRFWEVAATSLDLLDIVNASPARAAAILGITTSNLVTVLKSDRHLLAAAQIQRKRHGQKPLS